MRRLRGEEVCSRRLWVAILSSVFATAMNCIRNSDDSAGYTLLRSLISCGLHFAKKKSPRMSTQETFQNCVHDYTPKSRKWAENPLTHRESRHGNSEQTKKKVEAKKLLNGANGVCFAQSEQPTPQIKAETPFLLKCFCLFYFT